MTPGEWRLDLATRRGEPSAPPPSSRQGTEYKQHSRTTHSEFIHARLSRSTGFCTSTSHWSSVPPTRDTNASTTSLYVSYQQLRSLTFFNLPNPFSRTTTLSFPQPLSEMSATILPGGGVKRGRHVWLTP
jgi:hypothetical protein